MCVCVFVCVGGGGGGVLHTAVNFPYFPGFFYDSVSTIYCCNNLFTSLSFYNHLISDSFQASSIPNIRPYQISNIFLKIDIKRQTLPNPSSGLVQLWGFLSLISWLVSYHQSELSVGRNDTRASSNVILLQSYCIGVVKKTIFSIKY